MRQLLKLHPDSRGFTAAQIEVELAHPRADCLLLSYHISGKMSDVRMPPRAPRARSDGLWRHTCFEAFLRAGSSAEYYEFNFAPSTQWAAYRFTSYRNEMSVAEIETPAIEVHAGLDRYTLQATIRLDFLPAVSDNALWRLGLSAVIEDTSGRMSYWALAHPPGKPDFHHADGFALELAPAAAS